MTFQLLITSVIVVNSILLALDKYPESKYLSDALEKANIGFSLLFVIELVIKLAGLGFSGYFMDSFNVYDCIIVLASLLDIFLTNLL